MTYEEYKRDWLPILFTMPERMTPNGMTCQEYYNGHESKFIEQFNLFNTITLNSNSIVLDLGTPLPFISYLFYAKYKCTIVCSDLFDRSWGLQKVYHRQSNLNKLSLEKDKFDLVILSSVIPHVPGNIVTLLNTVIDSIKDSGLLFIEMPIAKCEHIENVPYNQELNVDMDIYHDNFSRSFTVERLNELLNMFPQLSILIGNRIGKTKLYNDEFCHRLMQVNKDA